MLLMESGKLRVLVVSGWREVGKWTKSQEWKKDGCYYYDFRLGLTGWDNWSWDGVLCRNLFSIVGKVFVGELFLSQIATSMILLADLILATSKLRSFLRVLSCNSLEDMSCVE